MIRIVLLVTILSVSLPVEASHPWAKIDICETYKDKLPPGLTRDSLPETNSHAAVLLSQYCTQCHNMPGPDRHTVTEWRDLSSKMFMLMDVSNRFGGLMGKVKTINPQDRIILLAYLQRYAAKSEIVNSPADGDSTRHPWLARTVALLPVFLLTGVGLLRWWRKSGNGHKSCVINRY